MAVLKAAANCDNMQLYKYVGNGTSLPVAMMNIVLTLLTAFNTPSPLYLEPPSRISKASLSPVDAPYKECEVRGAEFKKLVNELKEKEK